MKFNIPKVLAKLGTMRSMSVKFLASETTKNAWHPRFNHVHYMCTDASGKTLYLIKAKSEKEASSKMVKARAAQITRTSKMFALWNDFAAHEVDKISFSNGKNMHLFGYATDIIYQSKKWDDNARYIHDFTSNVKVYVPFKVPKKKSDLSVEQTRRLWRLFRDAPIVILKGGKLKVTKEGIIG